MRRIRFFTGMILGMAATLVIGGSALSVSAQNADVQYQQWQRAQAQANEEYREYLRTRSARDYRQWQIAVARANREKAQYDRVASNRRMTFGFNQDSSGYNQNMRRYRVYRDGSSYDTDYRGAELLRTAVRNGYQQGYQEGRNDRRNGRRADYDARDLYRSGTYGYQSYVDRGHYQHYYRQGFQRGYEDGYYSTSRYGSGTSILGNVLSSILSLTDN
jgi:hypothetical protein